MAAKRVVLFTVLVVALCMPRAARADAIVNVSVDTSSLSGLFSVFFQMTDGGNGVHNSVTVSNFSLGTGTLLPDDSAFGDVSGNLITGLTLSDGDFLNFFVQSFNPGLALSFQMTMSSLFDAATPDAFAFSILDASGAPITTSDPTGANSLLSVFFNGQTPEIASYGAQVTPVPEPGTFALLGLGVGAWLGLRRLRRR